MADGVTIRIDTRKLLAKMAALPPELQARVAAAALQGAQEMASLARDAVPSQTGHLRSTIKAEAMPELLGAKVTAGDESTMVEVRKGSGVKWQLANLVEFGTRKHRAGGLFKGAWISARPHPFFWPSYRLLKRRILSRIVRATNKAFKEVSSG